MKNDISKPLFDFSWSVYLKLISIITPHFSSELARRSGLVGHLDDIDWPVAKKQRDQGKEILIVIQVNGKKRGRKL